MSDTAVDTALPIDNGIMAMTDDDGVVITLYQNDPEHGAVVRSSGEWVPLVDPEVIEDLAFVGVQDSAVDLYDEHAADDKLVPIKFYSPSAEGPYWTQAIPLDDDEVVEDEEDEVSEEPIAASVTLASAEDLDAAIAAAAENPELRWYVERRVAALGLEASLPWQKG